MSRLKLFGAMALMTVFSFARVHAAAPAIPADSVSSDTVAVIHVDAGHFNPDVLRAAAQTVLGQNAAKAEDGIAKFKEKFDKGTAAGITGMTMVVGDKKKAEDGAPSEPPTVIYFFVKPGADVKEIEKLITTDMSPADKEKAAFTEKGGHLVMYKKDQPLPASGDAGRAKAFSDALGTISDVSVQVAFIPTAKIKEQIQKESQNEAPVKGLKDAGPLLANANWMTVAVNFGTAPAISFSANLADAGSAKQLADAVNASLDDLKAQAANQNGAGPFAMFGPLINQLVEGLRPVTSGSQVTVALKGQGLTAIAGFAAQMGVLGGGPGAGGPPK